MRHERSTRFRESTRGRIVALLRRGERTVDEVATTIGMTDNAVRSHLTALERDGLIRQSGVRRTPGAGKPAALFELDPSTEALLSSAYPPVLAAVLEALVAELPSDLTVALLRDAGRRIALQLGGRAEGSELDRVRAAAAVLIELGGDVDVEHSAHGLTIKGSGCPLSAAVSRRPELCQAVEALVTEISGVTLMQCCQHGERPRCCFRVEPAA
jgi:predicted ArsR family transcriptional regulator